jgi:hypothetical protein
MGEVRQEFSQDVIRKLGEMVGLACSNPQCRAPTKGPHSDGEKSINVGMACHIHAAAPGGPRYDPNQTSEERRGITNGIWLCFSCGKLVDADEQRFPARLLRAWRTLAEAEASVQIGRPPVLVQPAVGPTVELSINYQRQEIRQELHRYELQVSLKNTGTRRIDDWYMEVEFPVLPSQEPGIMIGGLIRERSNHRRSLFRTSLGDLSAGPGRKVLPVGDEWTFLLPYWVNNIFSSHKAVFAEAVKARAFVNGELAREVSRLFDELQCF